MAKKKQPTASRLYVGRDDIDMTVMWSEDWGCNLPWPVAADPSAELSVLADITDDPVPLNVWLFGSNGKSKEALREELASFRKFVRIICTQHGLPNGRWRMEFGELRDWNCIYVVRLAVPTDAIPYPDIDYVELSGQMRSLACALYGYRAGLLETRTKKR